MSQSTQLVLSLAHLLQQHSLSYDDEKSTLLDASVKLAMDRKMSNQEVHIVLSGSPRPTFAETNAWLLQNQSHGTSGLNNGPINGKSIGMSGSDAGGGGGVEDAMNIQAYVNNPLLQDPNGMNNSSTLNSNINDLCGSPTRIGGSVLENYQAARSSKTAGTSVATVAPGEAAAGGAGDAEAGCNTGPLVGQAIKDAVKTEVGRGLLCSRAQLLQGTIDRPLWDQRRWTDGECLFSELVKRIGLESFENSGEAMRGGPRAIPGTGPMGEGADAAAGGLPAGLLPRSTLGQAGLPLHKTTNLSAHLITVPPQSSPVAGVNVGHATPHSAHYPGMEETTMEEIARCTLRFLKRKRSPPVSSVVIVLPPLPNDERILNAEVSQEREGLQGPNRVVADKLLFSWNKLERYNDMIGEPKLMDQVQLEFVRV